MTQPKKKRKRKKKNNNMLRWLSAAVGTIAVAGCVLYCVLLSGSAPSSAVIKIPKGGTSQNVSDSLTLHLGPAYAKKVMKLAGLRGTDFRTRHGAYLVEAGASPLTAMLRLTGGAQQPVTITINGFRLLPVLEEKVASKFEFSEDSLKNTLNDPDVLAPYGLSPTDALALFLNDSYEFYWSVSPKEMVEKIGAHWRDVWSEDRRAKASALGLTPAEVTRIASIVDEETNALEEKGTVGRLYINRLKKGMRLQADPTVRYAVGDFSIRRVTGKHLQVDNPYNTYRYAGLPPGPIRTTSMETIDAILDSSPHEYIYMCAKEDFSGRHNFAVTYAEHQANARRYQEELNRRGVR